MTRSDLEKYLVKVVSITLFDNDVKTGKLHRTGEEMFKNDANLCLPQKRCF